VALNGHSIYYKLLYGEGNEDHQLGTGFFIHKIILSAVDHD
jgi:hypothetical protein